MKRQVNKLAFLAMTILLVAPQISKAENADDEWKKEIERKIEILTREAERKSLSNVVTPVSESKHGFGPAASKIYNQKYGVSIGGYGEMLLEDPQGTKDDGTASGRKRQLDFLRNIVYIGYKFNDKILFNSEIEYEHASTTEGGARGEVSVEFAYLDFKFNDIVGARAGMVLVPVGLVNELHEPTLFFAAKRPGSESKIIPSTWRENGAGVFGDLGPIEYRSYILAGLQSTAGSGLDGFTGSNGIRGGRSKGAKSVAEDLAWVTRVDYTCNLTGAKVGGSYYSGKAGQNAVTTAGDEIDAPVNMWEVHALYQLKGLDAKAMYVQNRVGDVAALNNAQGFTGNQSIGQKSFGGYVEVGFDVLSFFQTNQSLSPFFRYDRYDTQQEVPNGFSKNPANSVKEWTFGINYKPIPNIVFKGDWQNINNQAGTGVDQVNLAMGYIY